MTEISSMNPALPARSARLPMYRDTSGDRKALRTAVENRSYSLNSATTSAEADTGIATT